MAEDKIYGGYIVREFFDNHDRTCTIRSEGRILVKAEDEGEAVENIIVSFWENERKYTPNRHSKRFSDDKIFVRGLKEGSALAKATGFSVEELEDLVGED